MTGWWLLLPSANLGFQELLLAGRLLPFQAAGITDAAASAVGRGYLIKSALVLPFQESRRYSDINMSPRQEFIQGTLPTGVKAGLKSRLCKGLGPVFVVKLFAPGIKGTAQLPGAIDNLAQSSVPS